MNEKKTVAVIFSKSKKEKGANVPITINGRKIETVKTVKFLGMTFDQELNWNVHSENILKNSKGKINLLRSLTGYRWVASKKTILRIYNTLIKPKVEYGIELFHTSSKKSIENLEKK